MAKKIQIDIEVNGKMQKATVSAKKLEKALKGADAATEGLETSSRNAERQLKGTARTSSNSTKNFSKMAQGITGGLVPAYATLAANLFALSAAFNFFKNASQLENLEKSQLSFAQTTGIAMASVTNGLREASQGMLGFREAAQAAAIGTAKGFSPEQLNKLAEGAMRASVALGRDFADAFDRLVRGVSKAEPELLDELGITLRLERATKSYADALGLEAKALTEAQRSQAVLLETQRQLDEIFQNEAAANPFIKLDKAFEDLIKTVTQKFLPVISGIADIISNNIAATITVFGLFSLSILKAAFNLSGLQAKVDDWAASHSKAATQAKNDMEAYRTQIERSEAAQKKLKEAAKKTLQGSAQKALDQGSSSALLKKVAAGGIDSLAKVDQANLKRFLKKAEQNVDASGRVMSGVFKGVHISVVQEMNSAFAKIDSRVKITEGRWKLSFKNIQTFGKIMLSGLVAATRTATTAMINMANAVGNAFMKVVRILSVVGLAQIFGSLAMEFTQALDGMFRKVAKFFGMEDTYKNSDLGKALAQTSVLIEKHKELKSAADSAGDAIKNMSGDIDGIVKGMNKVQKQGFNSLKAGDDKDALEAFAKQDRMRITAMATLPLESIMEKVTDIARMQASGATDEANKLLKKLNPELEKLATVSPRVAQILQQPINTWAESFAELQSAANDSLGTLTSFEEQLTGLEDAMRDPSDPASLSMKILQIQKTLKDAQNKIGPGALSEKLQKDLDALSEKMGMTNDQFLAFVQDEISNRRDAIRLGNEDAIRREKTAGMLDRFAQARQKFLDDELAAMASIALKENDLRYLQKTRALLNADEVAARDEVIYALEQQIEKEKAILEIKQEQETVAMKLRDLDQQADLLQKEIQLTQVAKTLNDVISKRLQMEQNIADLKDKQLQREINAASRERSRTPMQGGFINEGLTLKDQIAAQEALIARMEQQSAAQLAAKNQAIDLEYDLLALQTDLEATRLRRLALERSEALRQDKQDPSQDSLVTRTNEMAGRLETQADAYGDTGEGSMRDTAKTLASSEVSDGLAAANEQLEIMKQKLNDTFGDGELNEYMANMPDTLTSGFTDAFMSIMDGTKSVKQAFGEMAKAMIADIMRIIIKLLIQRAIMAAMGMADGGVASPSGPKMRYGGIVKPRGYRYGGYTEAPQMAAIGGVFKGPNAGYPVIMHGTEAVVPLPNGREIPVEMKGGGGQNNNVTVNISMDNSGAGSRTQSSNGQDANQLGTAVAAAVQRELQNQKRAGGILSPYGAA